MQLPSRWTRRACRSAILIEPRADLPQPITLGVDKAYDDRGFRQRVALDEGDAACGADTYGARRRLMAARRATHRRRRIVKADICDRQHLAICSR
jgi:hypothetical protein